MKGNRFEQTDSSLAPAALDKTKISFAPENISAASATPYNDPVSTARDNQNASAASRAIIKSNRSQIAVDIQPAVKAQYLGIATSRAFPHVQQWFINAAANMRNDVTELRRTCNALTQVDLPKHHRAIDDGRIAGTAQRDAHLSFLQSLQSLRQWQCRIGTAWLTEFREAASEHMAELRAMEESLLSRLRLAEEWTSFGQRDMVLAQLARVRERRDGLAARAAREKERGNARREQTLQHIRGAMDGLVGDMKDAVSWAQQQRLRGRVFTRPIGALSNTWNSELCGGDEEERQLLSEARRLRAEIRRVGERNKILGEKSSQAIVPRREGGGEVRGKKTAKAQEKDVEPKAMPTETSTAVGRWSFPSYESNVVGVKENPEETEGEDKDRMMSMAMKTMPYVGASNNPEEDPKAKEEVQSYDTNNTHRNDSGATGSFLPPLTPQTQTSKPSETSKESTEKMQALNNVQYQRPKGSPKVEVCLPQMSGTGHLSTSKHTNSASSNPHYFKDTLCAPPDPVENASVRASARSYRLLRESLHRRTAAVKRPPIVHPPNTTDRDASGRYKVSHLAGLLSALKEDTSHFDAARLSMSQDVHVLREELHNYRSTTADLLLKTQELEAQRAQLRLQCEAQNRRLCGGAVGRNVRTITENVDMLLINGELEETVKVLQDQCQRRRTESSKLKEQIADLQCRIADHDTLLQHVSEYWRRNAAAMKRIRSPGIWYSTVHSNETDSHTNNSTRPSSRASAQHDFTLSVSAFMQKMHKTSSRRLRGTPFEALSATGVSFLDNALSEPEDIKPTLLKDGRTHELGAFSPETTAPMAVSHGVDGMDKDTEIGICEGYQGIPALKLNEPDEIADFIYGVFINGASCE